MKTQQLIQILLASIGCGTFLLLIHRLAKVKKLSFRYTLGWIALGITGIISVIVIPFASEISEIFHLSPAAILATGAVILLVAICVQLSISISGLQEQTRLLAEEISLLKARK